MEHYRIRIFGDPRASQDMLYKTTPRCTIGRVNTGSQNNPQIFLQNSIYEPKTITEVYTVRRFFN